MDLTSTNHIPSNINFLQTMCDCFICTRLNSIQPLKYVVLGILFTFNHLLIPI